MIDTILFNFAIIIIISIRIFMNISSITLVSISMIICNANQNLSHQSDHEIIFDIVSKYDFNRWLHKLIDATELRSSKETKINLE